MSVPRKWAVRGLAACVLAVPILAFVMGIHLRNVMSDARESRSLCKFSFIKAMLLRYHDEHGCFPPVKYQATENGPIHSWRVLLLRHTDPDDYSKYDFSQAWDSPQNMQAVGESISRDYCGMDDSGIARYLAIGEGEPWPSRGPLKALRVTQGQDQFLVVEYPDSDIFWMEPRH